VHSSMLVQEAPVPENPVLHAHVKAPWVLVHAALVSQLWVPSAIEGRGARPVTSSVALKRVSSVEHTGLTAIDYEGPRCG
jgi:hypothetical protein